MIAYQISVFIHILSAIVWIGGMLFLALVVVPTTRGLPPGDRVALFGAIGRRFRTVGWVCIGLLLATGTINSIYRGVTWDNLGTADLWGSAFGRTLAVKLGVVAVLLALSVYHDFIIGPRSVRARAASREAERLRRTASYVGRAEALLALVVVALAVMLVRGLPF